MLSALLWAMTASTSTAPLPPAGDWAVDPAPGVCRASQAFGPGGTTTLKLVALPLSGTYALTVDLPHPITAAYDDRVELSTEPGGRAAAGEAIGIVPGDSAPHGVGLLVPRTLLTAPLKTLSLRVHGVTVASLSPGDPTRIAARLAACTDDLLRSYGIDPSSQSAVAVWPEAEDGGQWFKTDAYPPAALRAGAQGRVTVKLLIADDGAVADCTTIRSSGNADLDEETCRIARAKARFRPAKDRSGHPVPALQLLSTRWTLAGG